MRNLKKMIAFGFATVMCAAVFAACGSTESAGDGSTETLIMATNAAFPPYEYVEGDDYLGIDVEIAQAIADKVGCELKIEDVDFGSIIAGVQTGKYDFGMAGMTVTDERKKSVDFSETYATGVQSIIVPEGSDIQSADDLSADIKIGVQQDTTGDIYASEDYGEDAVVRYKTGADAVQALVSGKVDCVIIDNEPAKSYVATNDGLVVLDTAYVEEEYAICVAKDNTDFLNDINAALDELKADGTIDKIIAEYISAE